MLNARRKNASIQKIASATQGQTSQPISWSIPVNHRDCLVPLVKILLGGFPLTLLSLPLCYSHKPGFIPSPEKSCLQQHTVPGETANQCLTVMGGLLLFDALHNYETHITNTHDCLTVDHKRLRRSDSQWCRKWQTSTCLNFLKNSLVSPSGFAGS